MHGPLPVPHAMNGARIGFQGCGEGGIAAAQDWQRETEARVGSECGGEAGGGGDLLPGGVGPRGLSPHCDPRRRAALAVCDQALSAARNGKREGNPRRANGSHAAV